MILNPSVFLGPKPEEDPLYPIGFTCGMRSLFISSLAINVLSLALPVMTLQVYDRILPNQGSGTLPVLMVGVFVAVMLETVLRLCRGYTIDRAGATYDHLLSCQAMKSVLNADLSRMGTYGTGEYLNRMGAAAKIKDFYNGQVLTTLVELIFVPVFFALMVFIAGILTVIPALILGLFVYVCYNSGLRLRNLLEEREEIDNKRFNFLIEVLEGVHTLKSMALEKTFERQYESLEERSTLQNFRVTEGTAGTFNAAAIFSHIMVTGVITAGAILVLYGHLTTGALIATLLLSGRMMQPVQKALALWMQYQDYTLARGHLQDLLSTPQHMTAATEGTPLVRSEGRLRLENIRFKHPDETQWQINKVNLNIASGEIILLAGGHGAGKTTLLNLIAGIYPPTEGHIVVDGRNIRDYRPDILTRHIGYIRTNSLMFRGTIRDNITCFGLIDESQAQNVAALLEVDRDVARLPGGFDTMLNGNDTDNIPPGLKHRIAIVRVMATKPRLILFDNADRSLDKNGYAMMYSLLARLKGKASMILVSEDRNICALADRTYLLQDGVLVPQIDAQVRTNIRPYRELRL